MDAHQKALGSCNKHEDRICAEGGKGISFVKRREKRGVQVYIWTIEKKVYQTIEIASNGTGVFCRQER